MINDTQSRFVTNIQKKISGPTHPKSNSGVFQNNYLGQKGSAGLMKTFYNSKQTNAVRKMKQI